MFYNRAEVVNTNSDQLHEKMRIGEDLFLLDVRTQAENAVLAIPGSHLIPIQELGRRLHEIPKHKEIIVYCRNGNRSAYASVFLASHGYKVKNLEGGIRLWNTIGHGLKAEIFR